MPAMKPKTEELLYFLLWTCDMLVRPTFRNVTDSYESWAYRNGLGRQLARLEREKFIEAGQGSVVRAVRLTESGRLHALGGRDPEPRWSRPWDGQWRLVLFDLPNEKSKLRNQLRNQLRQRGFGWLQDSVWISPDPLDTGKAQLAGSLVNVESLLFLKARPDAGESDAEIVAGAWDFERINQLYADHLKVLLSCPTKAVRDEAAAKLFREWAERERLTWQAAVAEDPLLPEPLLPPGYLGREAWRARKKAMRTAAELLRAFTNRA